MKKHQIRISIIRSNYDWLEDVLKEFENAPPKRNIASNYGELFDSMLIHIRNNPKVQKDIWGREIEE